MAIDPITKHKMKLKPNAAASLSDAWNNRDLK